MAFSIQRAVSDGTLQEIMLSLVFISRSDISVTVGNVLQVEGVDYTWETDNLISFTDPVPAGAEVVLRRSTDLAQLLNIFSLGAVFNNATMDENFEQLLFVAQEAKEGGRLTDVFNDVDMHGYTFQNLQDAVNAQSPVTLAQLNAYVVDSAAVLRQELAAPDGVALIGGLIADDLTINVPADQPTIAGAMSWLRERTIARGATVTIQVSDGLHDFTPPLDLNHPQGGQIKIIGNQADKAACVLLTEGEPTENGFVVSDGHQFGLVDGLTLRCSVKAASTWQGIVALRGASMTVGPNVEVDNWYYGIVARDGGSIACDGASVKNAGDVGFWAFAGGHIRCWFASVQNVRDTPKGLGFGFQAEYGSSMDCSSASATQCLVAGIAALSGSTVRAYSASSTGNDGDGLFARDGGTVVAHGATTTSNSGYGIGQRSSGRVFGNNITAASNTLGVNRPAAVLDNDALGARVLATGGPLRIDTGPGGFGLFFHTSGGLQLEVLHIEGAVNHPYLSGSAPGSPARLGVSGSDANIDLHLQTKGSGVVRFGGLTSTADVPITGFVTIKTDDGVLRKLAVIA